jgi:nicotinamidase-related amidase
MFTPPFTPRLISKITHSIAGDSILCVIDMQNDFTTGSFKINNNETGLAVLLEVLRLPWMKIAASKDFHPPDHMSFKDFPPHCVQEKFEQKEKPVDDEKNPMDGDENPMDGDENPMDGDENPMENPPINPPIARGGARFDEDVREALQRQKDVRDNVRVFFKAFNKHVDSFGASAYTEETAKERAGFLTRNHECLDLNYCINAFTGSFAFPLLNPDNIDSDPVGYAPELEDHTYNESRARLLLDGVERLDKFIGRHAPDPNYSKKFSPLKVFVCGLALDFCVQDTAINIKARFGDKVNVYVILDASTAAFPDLFNVESLTSRGIGLATMRGNHTHPFTKALRGNNAVKLHVLRQQKAKEMRQPGYEPPVTGWRRGGAAGGDDLGSRWPWIVQGTIVALVCALAGSYGR